MNTNSSLKQLLGDFAGELPGMAKQASIGDDTPDGTRSVKEGERSSENESDVREAIVDNVNEASKGPSGTGGENTPTNKIGTNKGETGTDVPSTKNTKDDPGTSHPAKAGPNGNGSGSTKEAEWAFDGDLVGLGNEILAGITVVTQEHEKRASAATAATQQQQQAAAGGAVNPQAAPAAGNAAAGQQAAGATEGQQDKTASAAAGSDQLTDDQMGYLAGQYALQMLGLDKQAAAANGEQPVVDVEAELTKLAEAQAREAVELAAHHVDLVAAFLEGHEKQALGGMGGEVTDPAALMAGGAAPGGTGGDPAGMGMGDPTGGAGGAPPPPPMAGGGAGAPPPPPPGAGAGMGADPGAGGGMGGGMGGGGTDPAALGQAFEQACAAAGLNPMDVLSALAGGGAGGGGDPAAAGGGGAAPGGPPAAGGDAGAAASSEGSSAKGGDSAGGSGKESGGGGGEKKKEDGGGEKQASAFDKLSPSAREAVVFFVKAAAASRQQQNKQPNKAA